eukprot:scaffold51181_cov57-Phaeocystis_antarctica.AAC.1
MPPSESSACMNSGMGSHPSMQPPTNGAINGRSSTTKSRVTQLRKLCGGGAAATKRSSSRRASLHASSASCLSFSGRCISRYEKLDWPCGLSWWERAALCRLGPNRGRPRVSCRCILSLASCSVSLAACAASWACFAIQPWCPGARGSLLGC